MLSSLAQSQLHNHQRHMVDFDADIGYYDYWFKSAFVMTDMIISAVAIINTLSTPEIHENASERLYVARDDIQNQMIVQLPEISKIENILRTFTSCFWHWELSSWIAWR